MPAQSVITASLVTGVVPGIDADEDGFPANTTVFSYTVQFDRRAPDTSPTLTANPPETVEIDEDDADPDMPVQSTFVVPLVPSVAPGPDADQDGFPEYALLGFQVLTFDRRHPASPALTPGAADPQPVDPDDADPDAPVQSSITVSVPVSTTLPDGTDEDRDGIPGRVVVTWTNVTFDRREPTEPELGTYSTEMEGEPNDGEPTFIPTDEDGDLLPDPLEVWACQFQSESTPSDGECLREDGTGPDGSGTNYVPPNPWNDGPL